MDLLILWRDNEGRIIDCEGDENDGVLFFCDCNLLQHRWMMTSGALYDVGNVHTVLSI